MFFLILLQKLLLLPELSSAVTNEDCEPTNTLHNNHVIELPRREVTTEGKMVSPRIIVSNLTVSWTQVKNTISSIIRVLITMCCRRETS